MGANIDYGFTPSEYQQRIFDFVLHGTGNAMIKACAGSGKCLGRDTGVLMYDGSIKKVQDIVVGDLIMGDDSTPRTVLSTTSGTGNLKRIVPKKGKPWVCNDVHVLTLDKYCRRKVYKDSNYHITVDLPIDSDELKMAKLHDDRFFREYKLLKAGVEFSHRDVYLDPWLYGVWLGDGTTGQSYITNVDDEIIENIKKIVPSGHYSVSRTYPNRAPKISVLCDSHHPNKNYVRQFLRRSSNCNGKFILRDYLINDRATRLKLLAGLIDSDGYYKNNNYFIATKFEKLCNDIVFLARSLGLGANFTIRNKKCHNTGAVNHYYHITINGNLEEIPVVLKRKKATPRKIRKNHLHTGFKIEDYGVGEYYGFELDGNGRFLLDDFTVTHNTSTLIAAMKILPKRKSCLFIAFNKSIVEEIREKIKGHGNCTVKTIHSLGYTMLQRNIQKEVEINEFKYRVYVKEHIQELTDAFERFNLTIKEFNDYAENVISLIDYSRFNLAQCEREIKEIAVRYNIPIAYDECAVVVKCLEWGKENIETIDYTDMVWLPIELSMSAAGLTFDWIFFDEAQDASLMAIELFKKCIKRGTRIICAGDPDQSIYMFAGASEDAFNKIISDRKTTLFTLPITYRCAKKIVKFANNIVEDIIPRDDAPEGMIVENVVSADLRDGDMVLARSRTPLIAMYVLLLRRGMNCYIKGKEIGTNLIQLIDSVDGDELNRDLKKDGLFVRLYERMFNERNILMQNTGLDVHDATLLPRIMELYDCINALYILSDGISTRDELVARVESIFKEDSNGICLSTIHKAKGLENDRVIILCNSALPSKLAKKDWEKTQEVNLQYVAYTRAKTMLGFFSEDLIKPSANLMEISSILNDVKFIERRVCDILGLNPVENVDSVEYSRFKLKTATKVENIKVEVNLAVMGESDEDSDEMSWDDIMQELEE